jgi:DNA-binding NarL/FixJ family response regulator
MNAQAARILIVDDEPLNVDYLEQELEGLGFLTETAADGVEALERVSASPPDLVLLDVMMPRMDGISALRVLKQDPATRLIPVVLMTALNAVEDRVRGIEAGADDFLSKPVDDRELLARIRTALRLKRAIDETADELRSTSAYLERYGVRERDVAVLAVNWRLLETELPDEAVAFIGRRRRQAAERRVRALGGTTGRCEAGLMVAVFDAPDARARAGAAIDAALAVLAEEDPESPGQVAASAGVGAGPARVGSMRVGDGSGWAYGAEGGPVDGAVALARTAGEAAVTVTAEVAALVGERFALEAAGDAGYRVLGRAPDAVAAGRPAADRRVRTILVTDIVGSTRTAERVGDRAWSELVAAHDRATRAELVAFGGEEVNTTGDGFVALFDGPGRAIRCALAVMGRLDAHALRIRAGVHSGEIEEAEAGVQGIAVNLATRIAELAGAGEVLTSGTARDLAAGSGLEFADRGEHELKGISERRRVYAARERDAAPVPDASADVEPGDGFPAGLTAREVDVLRLVAIGLSDAEAADRLVVSVRTVNAHLRSIYRKLGVSSRAAAGRFAQTNGLLKRGI